MKLWLIGSLFSLMVLQITACSLLGPAKVPPINTYTLAATSNPAAISQRRQQVLLVAAPTAVSGYQNTNMLYTLRPYELKSFARNRWAAPPADMLAPLLAQNLQASGCFRAVVSPPFTGYSDLVLDARLLNLQQDFTATTSVVHMALQLTLSDNKTHQLLINKRIETTVPVAENTPYAGVIAANTATDILLGKTRQLVCRVD